MLRPKRRREGRRTSRDDRSLVPARLSEAVAQATATSTTAMIELRKIPSNVPAPPIAATPAPSELRRGTFRRSAPISVPKPGDVGDGCGHVWRNQEGYVGGDERRSESGNGYSDSFNGPSDDVHDPATTVTATAARHQTSSLISRNTDTPVGITQPPRLTARIVGCGWRATGHGEGVDRGSYTGMASGGLVGLVIGVLDGPLGILIGGATGLLIRSLVDIDDADDTESVLSDISNSVGVGLTAFLAELTEHSSEVIDTAMARLGGIVLRRSVDEVEAEIAASE
jgi:hypothetical protein